MPTPPFANLVSDSPFTEALLQYILPGNTNPYSIVFDAVLSEDWDQGATITEHPVEEGANVSDHVRVSLQTCMLKIRVTNEPLDSNTFVDPIGGAGQLTAIGGLMNVWNDNRDIGTQIGQLANLTSGIVADVADTLVNATPLGNLLARAIRPVLQASVTGNQVIYYPPLVSPPVGDALAATGFDGIPLRSVGDAAGLAVFDAIQSARPPGFNEPTLWNADVVQFAPGAQADFAQLMIQLLCTLKNQAQILTVYGSKQTMANMVIETLQWHRGATEETGTGADISIGLKVVRIVQTQTVAAPVPGMPRATSPINAGAQDGEQATEPESVTVLEGIDQRVSGALKRAALAGAKFF